MIHARSDYQHIQDPSGNIPEDEPVFLLRAKDICAPDTISHWAHLAEFHGADKSIIEAALDQATAMRKWQRENGVGKIPDMPEGSSIYIKQKPVIMYDYNKIPIFLHTGDIETLECATWPGIHYYYSRLTNKFVMDDDIESRLRKQLGYVLQSITEGQVPAGLLRGYMDDTLLSTVLSDLTLSQCDALITKGINPIRIKFYKDSQGGTSKPTVWGSKFVTLYSSALPIILNRANVEPRSMPATHDTPFGVVNQEFNRLAQEFDAVTIYTGETSWELK